MLPKERPCPIENKMILTDDNIDLSMSLAIPVGGIIINTVQLDQVISGIYLTNSSDYWTPSKLRAHGFTHLIYIDQHIRNNSNNNNNNDDRRSNSNNDNDNNNNCNNNLTKSTRSDMRRYFEVIDLDFGEASYLATVLPNCDKAVRFIEKALENGGLILVIDQNTDQKCLTIVIGYLMYKNHMNFNDAFEKVKNVFTNADLEKFFMSQLYEYEPILEVQRTFSRGSSYSSEMRRSHLKRKKPCDDYGNNNNNSSSNMNNHNYNNAMRYNNSNIITETSNNSNNNNNNSTDYVMME